MPKYSDNFLLQKSIDDAILDRDSFSDAYGRLGPESDEAKDLICKMKSLKGKSLDSMGEDETLVAYFSFLYAEQWRVSLSQAQSLAVDIRFSEGWARRFREVRLRRWGKSKLEVFMDNAKTIPINDRALLANRTNNKGAVS